MRIVFFCLLFFIAFAKAGIAQEKADCIKLSQELLYAVRTDELTDSLEKKLELVSKEELASQLKTDAERKAFWLNVYNAFTQISLKKSPDAYKKRNKFFKNKFIWIAGQTISLDLVEHGILRRSKAKYSLGHFNKLFKSKFEKQFRVDRLDYRIHFALNCGAKSCPPIAFYKPEQIDKQLDQAAKVYLKNEVMYDSEYQTVKVPAILGWFRGDFVGKKGIIKLLRRKRLSQMM